MNISEMTEKANDLFVLPESVTRLKACMDDQASSIDDISEIIAYDPALTTQLLRVSNSALYRFPNRIDTVTKAIQVVGTRSTYDLALAYGVSHAFKDIDSQIIDLKNFIINWDGIQNLVFVTHYVVISQILNYSSSSGEIVVSDDILISTSMLVLFIVSPVPLLVCATA